MALEDNDIFIFENDEIEGEEFITIPDTGIHDFTRPILYTALDEPAEIINLDAGNLRVDTSANVVGNLTSGSRAIPKNFTGISAYSSGSERSVNSDSLGGIGTYSNVGSFTTSTYAPNLHVGFGTYGEFGNALATNGNGSLIIVGNKKSIVDAYYVGIGTTVGIATYYGSAFLYERISNNFVKRDCIVGQYSKPGTGSTHGIGVTGTSNDDYGYSVTMAIDGKTFAVGGPNIIWERDKSTTTGIASTTKSGVVWIYDYKPPVDPEFCGVGTLPVCCGIGTSTICDMMSSNSIGLENSVLCGVGTTTICRTKNVEVLSVLKGEGDGDLFGYAISLSADGKTLVVGAPGLSCTSLGYNGGGAYVYDRNDTTYDKVGILTGLTSSGNFGNSVSVSGDGYIIVVGDSSQSKSYVYERDDKIYGSFRRIGTLSSGGTQVCISDDGETVITANASSSVVYDRSGSTFTAVGTLSGGSVGISCSPDGKIITTASASGYNVYNREGDVFYLNCSAGATMDSFDMSTDTKVIYRGNSAEIVSTAVTGRVYCDDQVLETFVYTDPNGNVGIATTSPTERLHVNGNSRLVGNVSGIGILTATSLVSVNLSVSGIKNFDIEHPSKDGWRLRYACLEGPSADVYIRGKLEDSNIIELPDYWSELVDQETITVNLTPFGIYQELFVEKIEWGRRIIVKNNLSGPIKCNYFVYAERKDVNKNVPEYQTS